MVESKETVKATVVFINDWKHSLWYVIRDKVYPSEVVELRPDVDSDAAKKVAEYRKKYAQESWYRGAVADAKRRTSNVTVRVLRGGDVDELAVPCADADGKNAAVGVGLGVDEVSTPVNVNLYWMHDVLQHMSKFNPTVPKGRSKISIGRKYPSQLLQVSLLGIRVTLQVYLPRRLPTLFQYNLNTI